MSVPTTQCITCGAPVSQRKADERGGLCIRCDQEAAAIPPDDFQIAPDLAQRLVSINEDPRDYRKIVWRNGADFVHGFIDELEQAKDLCRTWSPRLRDFAQQCRKKNLPPVDALLSNKDRAKQRIYESIIIKTERIHARPNKAIIFCMPLIAMPVAQRLWPGGSDFAVLLTPEEKYEWGEIYSHPQNSFWWFVNYWWKVDDSPAQEFCLGDCHFLDWDNNDLSEGQSPWLVTSGIQWGPNFGGTRRELWSWDGNYCKFIKNVGGMNF